MKRQSVGLLALLTAVGLAACGDSTDVVTELTEDEAEELASAVMMSTFSGATSVPQGQPATAGGPQLAPFELSFDVELVAECPMGGLVSIDATLDVVGDTESEAGTVSYVMDQVHDGCVVQSDNEQVFTLDGSPSVTVTLLADNNGQGVVSWSGSLIGSVAWSTEERQGECALLLEFSGTGNETAETLEFGLSGSVCQRSIEYSGSIG